MLKVRPYPSLALFFGIRRLANNHNRNRLFRSHRGQPVVGGVNQNKPRGFYGYKTHDSDIRGLVVLSRRENAAEIKR